MIFTVLSIFVLFLMKEQNVNSLQVGAAPVIWPPIQSSCSGPCILGYCPMNYTCQSYNNMCCQIATTTAIPCYDKMQNCYSYQYLCNNSAYYDLMTNLCSQTCNRCNSSKFYRHASSVTYEIYKCAEKSTNFLI